MPKNFQPFGRVAPAAGEGHSRTADARAAEPGWHAIPNSLSLGIACAFLVFAVYSRMPIATALWHVGVGIAVLIAMVRLVSIGAGAIKLTAAIVAWLGLEAGAVFFATAFLSCGLTGYVVGALRPQIRSMPFLPFAVGTIVLMVLLGQMPADLHL